MESKQEIRLETIAQKALVSKLGHDQEGRMVYTPYQGYSREDYSGYVSVNKAMSYLRDHINTRYYMVLVTLWDMCVKLGARDSIANIIVGWYEEIHTWPGEEDRIGKIVARVQELEKSVRAIYNAVPKLPSSVLENLELLDHSLAMSYVEAGGVKMGPRMRHRMFSVLREANVPGSTYYAISFKEFVETHPKLYKELSRAMNSRSLEVKENALRMLTDVSWMRGREPIISEGITGRMPATVTPALVMRDQGSHIRIDSMLYPDMYIRIEASAFPTEFLEQELARRQRMDDYESSDDERDEPRGRVRKRARFLNGGGDDDEMDEGDSH